MDRKNLTHLKVYAIDVDEADEVEALCVPFFKSLSDRLLTTNYDNRFNL